MVLSLALSSVAACSVYDSAAIASSLPNGQASAGRGATYGTGGMSGSAECPEPDGECSLPNALATCVSAVCLVTSCDPPYADCDETPKNGCEVDLTSLEHCGKCHRTCRFNHAAASCQDGQCVSGACEPGYADCDNDPSNGCERSVQTISNCGACDQACVSGPHGAAVCEEGQCALRCDSGYGNCNGALGDGCEQSLTTPEQCGSCNAHCAGPQVTAAECDDGHCAIRACAEHFVDCNGDAEDGCEADLRGADNCGACGASCELPHVSHPRCEITAIAPLCGIDTMCTSGEFACLAGERGGCEVPHADCDRKPENGCETDLERRTSCGSCQSSCVIAHTLTECRDQKCVTTGCAPGYDRCGGRTDCQSLSNDAQNCGECGHACPAATPNCVGGACTSQTCPSGTADCDASAGNKCETGLNTAQHCGGCKLACSSLPHASASCETGSCQVGQCQPGFGDCDHDPLNGCEVALNTTSDCGACGSSCVAPHGRATCDAQQCRVDECDPGHADCNHETSDGCETSVGTPERCGGCDTSCIGLPNVASAACETRGCRISCKSGFADCDGNPANGCETNLMAAASCGACDNDCTRLANIDSASCAAGTCTGLVCKPLFGECDGDAKTGCETSLQTAEACGACDKPCALAHAQTDCRAGECLIAMCDPGFADCDGNVANGCEVSLNSPDHCGTCTSDCHGAPCNNGVCGCLNDASCGTGEQCCDNQCVNTVGTCFLWPCIPGTALAANRTHCGGCAERCSTFCCGPLL